MKLPVSRIAKPWMAGTSWQHHVDVSGFMRQEHLTARDMPYGGNLQERRNIKYYVCKPWEENSFL